MVTNRKTLNTEAAWIVGMEVAADRAANLAHTFRLTPDEREDLDGELRRVVAERLVDRIRASASRDEARRWLWSYMGHPGAGSYVVNLLQRRGRECPFEVRDEFGDWPFHPEIPADWDADPCEILAKRETLSELVDDVLHAREQLARYLAVVSPPDRLVLEGRAAGLSFPQIAEREVGRAPETSDCSRQRQRYLRAWQRVPTEVHPHLQLLGLEPEFDTRKGHGKRHAA